MVKPWSKEEIKYLKDNYGKIMVKEIAINLNRTYNSVAQKVRILKLNGSKLGIIKSHTQQSIDLKYKEIGITCLDKYLGYNNKHRYICPYCNKEFTSSPSVIISRRKKSCGCARFIACSRTGTEQISGTHFSEIKHSAKIRNLEFNVTIEYISELLIKQNFKCALTDLPIEGGYNKHAGYKKPTCSLDRIDNSKGYIKGNVQWVTSIINQMKYVYSQEEFIYMCKLVSNKFRD